MAEQLLLPGIDAPPKQPATRRAKKTGAVAVVSHTIFFAIRPQAPDAQQIAALAAAMRGRYELKGSPTDAQRLHVTLLELAGYEGTRPHDKVARAMDAAATLAPPAFDVVFDHAMTFSAGPLVLCGREGVAELAAFRQRLAETLADAGFRPKGGYTPHMSLVYGPRRKLPAHDIAPVRWRAASFALIDSHQGEGVHEVLAEWPAPVA